MAKTLSVNKSPGKRDITGGQSLSQLSQEIRVLKSKVPVWMPIEGIPVMEEFKNLFRIKPLNRERITESIRLNGFDEKFSVIIAVFPDGTQSLAAGFTRKASAHDAGLTEIPAWTQEFPSVKAAIEWALHEQYDRRNLSDDEIYESVLRIDEYTKNGTHGFEGKSSVRTAEIAGISARKVEQIRTVDRQATEDQKEAIRSGDKSVNGIYQEIAGERRAQRCAPEGDNGSPEQGDPRAQDCTPSARDWEIESRGAKICLVRNGEAITLLSFESMHILYNGAPEKELRKVIKEYMEKIL